MMVVILAGTVISLFCVLQFIFHLPIRGNLVLFFSATIIYVFTTTGIGLFIATIAGNLAQVGLLTLMTFAPMVFLSGAWTPPEALVSWLRVLMKFSPLHYFLDVGLGILLKNAGLDILCKSILSIAVLGGGVFSFGLWRFRRQFD
jgi:ABC-2 type transport system permease protein